MKNVYILLVEKEIDAEIVSQQIEVYGNKDIAIIHLAEEFHQRVDELYNGEEHELSVYEYYTETSGFRLDNGEGTIIRGNICKYEVINK